MTFTVIPAIDVRDGRVVRLNQGDYERQTIYGDSPIEAIREYANDGAAVLHLVDLDAARVGHYTLAGLVEDIRKQTVLRVQTGGGVRSESDVEAILNAGAERVVVGTLAVREPEMVTRWLKTFGPDHITLALDARQDEQGAWRLPIKGWTEVTTRTLEELLAIYAEAGLHHVLCTDISRDGMLSGFNIDLYQKVAADFPGLQLQASGGVRSLEDIRAARDAGASGAILGRALLEKRFTLKDALAC
ncbi:MAG: 1-(5-phosphoribosyl)-5-[(5-phosphoribosylamino)methylideneamino]imidazole-4-carboxamide isomerase [Vicinamibacteria bacterium]